MNAWTKHGSYFHTELQEFFSADVSVLDAGAGLSRNLPKFWRATWQNRVVIDLYTSAKFMNDGDTAMYEKLQFYPFHSTEEYLIRFSIFFS
jgi:hypothetical protein